MPLFNPGVSLAQFNRIGLGTAAPNPGTARLSPLPVAMASPPTITLGAANAASAIASKVSLAATSVPSGTYILNPSAAAWWRYLRGNILVKGQTFPNRNFVQAANVQGAVGTGAYAVEFEFDGSQFEININGQLGELVRIMVDGQYALPTFATWGATTAYASAASSSVRLSLVQPTVPTGFIYQAIVSGTSAGSEPTWPTGIGATVVDGTVTWENVGKTPGIGGPPGDGNGYLWLVNFSTRAIRRITLEFSGVVTFGGLNIGPNDTVWVPSSPVGPRIVVIGDSYTAGTGAQGIVTHYVDTLCKTLGWRDYWSTGIGGSGYTVDGSGVKFATRVQSDVIAFNPDIVIVVGGQNDVGGSVAAATVQTAAASLYATIKSGLPNCKLIVVGPQSTTGSPVALAMQTRDALATAGVGLADLVIDNIGGTAPYDGTASHYVNTGWITGTGKITSVAGAGNADFYIYSDGAHPSQGGHDYYGRRMAASIAAAMPF